MTVVNLPPRFARAQLSGIPEGPLAECVRQYGAHFAEARGRGVAPLFAGVTQGFKTYAAAVLAKAVAERGGCKVEWVNCPEAFAVLERRRFEASTDATLQRWKRVDFLVLDDFTQAARVPHQLNLLVELGTHRFDHLRPTLYTGNIALAARNTEALGALVGPCLARRILEGSEGFRVIVK